MVMEMGAIWVNLLATMPLVVIVPRMSVCFEVLGKFFKVGWYVNLPKQ